MIPCECGFPRKYTEWLQIPALVPSLKQEGCCFRKPPWKHISRPAFCFINFHNKKNHSFLQDSSLHFLLVEVTAQWIKVDFPRGSLLVLGNGGAKPTSHRTGEAHHPQRDCTDFSVAPHEQRL